MVSLHSFGSLHQIHRIFFQYCLISIDRENLVLESMTRERESQRVRVKVATAVDDSHNNKTSGAAQSLVSLVDSCWSTQCEIPQTLESRLWIFYKIFLVVFDIETARINLNWQASCWHELSVLPSTATTNWRKSVLIHQCDRHRSTDLNITKKLVQQAFTCVV